ncbi:hypothetical protein CGRA01v4_05420 [Colletotrichum graminicola]|nr:hypothetical protein CGRA01v4_05420 [Colletotrichum graminicola]
MSPVYWSEFVSQERHNHSNGDDRYHEPGTWLFFAASAERPCSSVHEQPAPGRPAWDPGRMTGPACSAGLVLKRSTSMW